MTQHQQTIKCFTRNGTTTWLQERPKPRVHRTWAAPPGATASSPAANCYAVHGIVPGTDIVDIKQVLTALGATAEAAYWYRTKGGYTGIEVAFPQGQSPTADSVLLDGLLVSIAPQHTDTKRHVLDGILKEAPRPADQRKSLENGLSLLYRKVQPASLPASAQPQKRPPTHHPTPS